MTSSRPDCLHELVGTVVTGDMRGRTIGFPTANLVLDTREQAPAPGVYAGLADGRPAAVNVGTRPTFTDASPGVVIEVHVLDFSGDLYGQTMRLRLLKRLRGERRFTGVEELVAQLDRDIADVRSAVQRTDRD